MNKEEIKYCKFCDTEKPINEFCKSGLTVKNICKECNNKKQKQIYQDSKKVQQLEKQNQKYKEAIDKAKSLNEEISHIIYEDFLEENVIGCKYLYERIKKQLDILKEVE